MVDKGDGRRGRERETEREVGGGGGGRTQVKVWDRLESQVDTHSQFGTKNLK